MKIFAETERLFLREVIDSDVDSVFLLESNPIVKKYTFGEIVRDTNGAKKVITSIRKQYDEFGIGRWAVVTKLSGAFVGICGIRFVNGIRNGHSNYYSLGYKLLPDKWGKGYATESSIAAVSYGFSHVGLSELFANVNVENTGSRRVLEKVGLEYVEEFQHQGHLMAWYQVRAEDWSIRNDHLQ